MICSVYNSSFESRRQRQCTRLWEHLEAHLVRELALGEGEGGLQVLPQDSAVSVALDGGQDLGRSKYEVLMIGQDKALGKVKSKRP